MDRVSWVSDTKHAAKKDRRTVGLLWKEGNEEEEEKEEEDDGIAS
jgi:hypothetical protein